MPGRGREPLDAIRERARRELARLPNELHSLETASQPYRVRRSRMLEQTAETTRQNMERFRGHSTPTDSRAS